MRQTRVTISLMEMRENMLACAKFGSTTFAKSARVFWVVARVLLDGCQVAVYRPKTFPNISCNFSSKLNIVSFNDI